MTFKQIYLPIDLARKLGVSLETINQYFFELPEEERYFQFNISKRNGKSTRKISAPKKEVKAIQRDLLDLLKDGYHPRHCVHGFVPKRSIRSNAQVHTSKKWIVKTDIRNFFPSINSSLVQGVFTLEPFLFNVVVARLIANICCHKDQLPQGSPTSPLISNLICRDMDERLTHLAIRNNVHYTRYCDDITFSGQQQEIPREIFVHDPERGGLIGTRLKNIIEENGFMLNWRKSKVFYRSRRQLVTGLVVNEGIAVTKEFRRDIRKAPYLWKTHGFFVFERFMASKDRKNRPKRKSLPSWESVLLGKIQYLGSVLGWDSGYYKQFSNQFKELKKLSNEES